jgi:hypothetical protein
LRSLNVDGAREMHRSSVHASASRVSSVLRARSI